MGNGAIDGIKGITRGISDTAYNLATGKAKKVRLPEFIVGHGSMQAHHVGQGPTVWGFGFAQSSSGTASSTF